jgi:murein DD-endopeptidase MepM/ murein hydrolase activator NlpD
MLIGAVVTVAVLGSACGQYPGVHRDPVAGERPASVTTAQPPASPVSGAGTAPAPPRGADGATGPGRHAISGGGGTSVDLSRIFPVQHPGGGSGTTSGSGSNQGSTSSTGGSKSSTSGAKGSSTGGSKGSTTGSSKTGSAAGGTHQGSGSPKPPGDDGANPGPPDIKGRVTPGEVPTGSLDLATLVSRETVQGAKYNSTVLPKGFPLLICPVQGKYSYSDGYGAPRYAGGYHPHAGVDIFADQGTPIVAPFDGYVSRDPNTLGGNAVQVKGAQGYVYMAHLVSYGITDQNVKAGTVVGFVGNTGDAQGTSFHDHFEWHPNVVAPYDRQIAGTNGAVDPFPYLQVVCPPD